MASSPIPFSWQMEPLPKISTLKSPQNWLDQSLRPSGTIRPVESNYWDEGRHLGIWRETATSTATTATKAA